MRASGALSATARLGVDRHGDAARHDVKPSTIAATKTRTANGCGTSPAGVHDGVVAKPMRLLGDEVVP